VERVFSHDVEYKVLLKSHVCQDLQINQARYKAMNGRYSSESEPIKWHYERKGKHVRLNANYETLETLKNYTRGMFAGRYN
jgi:hypothetical protein